MSATHISTREQRIVARIADRIEAIEVPAGAHTTSPWPLSVHDADKPDEFIADIIADKPDYRPEQWRLEPGGRGYAVNALVWHSDRIWISTVTGNVWEPGVSGWRPWEPGGGIAAWIQPTGAHDAYSRGASVTHNGHTWESSHEANVWEPGVFGWTHI
jgi:hypothetical protein